MADRGRTQRASRAHRVDVQSALRIHMISDGEGTRGWVHTHGMDAFGKPELEIRGLPIFMAPSAASLLNAAADYILNSGSEVREGQTMQIGQAVFVLRADVPIPGAEEHWATPRWRLHDHPGMVGACCHESHEGGRDCDWGRN